MDRKYYHFNGTGGHEIRRYPLEGKEEKGERWDKKSNEWTDRCADEESCKLTGDKIISETEALDIISKEIAQKLLINE